MNEVKLSSFYLTDLYRLMAWLLRHWHCRSVKVLFAPPEQQQVQLKLLV